MRGTSTVWASSAKGLPVKQVALSSIDEIDSVYWFDDRYERPTVRREPDYRNCRPEDLPY